MLTLVTGASGSGKSEFAEGLVVESGNSLRYYIATMRPWDEECRLRILRHKRMREEKNFCTLEQYGCMKEIKLPERGGIVLLECLSNYAANLCFGGAVDKRNLADVMAADLECLEVQARELVIVTNEVFSDGGSYGEETVEYLHVLGALNVYLAKKADRVAEVVYGIGIWHKGGN